MVLRYKKHQIEIIYIYDLSHLVNDSEINWFICFPSLNCDDDVYSPNIFLFAGAA